MNFSRHGSSLLWIMLSSVIVHAQAVGDPAVPEMVLQARRYVEQEPSVRRRIGLAEILRSHGEKQAGIEQLQKAASECAPTNPLAPELHALVCWRMLPIAEAGQASLRQALVRLRAVQPDHPWAPIWEWCLIAREGNRSALLSALEKNDLPAPRCFPPVLAEKAHADLLQEMGWPRLQAGMAVIAARSHEPLHALRDLDRILTRAEEALRQGERKEDAQKIVAARDRCRQAYLKSARHVVEKLFALNLLGQTKERDTLLARAKGLLYLHERDHLSSLLEQMEEEQAWKLLIAPMLASELELIDQPPDLTRLKARRVTELRIQSFKKIEQGNTILYEGQVRFQLPPVEISCAQLTLVSNEQGASILASGSGKVQLRGLRPYPGGITADRFTFQGETGLFSLGGEVRLHQTERTVKLRSCTLSLQGELRDERSWLDDFRHVFNMETKLELLPKIVHVHGEKEIPDEVRYLLALQTLRPHLSWHSPYLPPQPEPHQRSQEQERESRDHVRESLWQEALPGEAWMWKDIPKEAMTAHREAIIGWYRAYAADPRHKNTEPPHLPMAPPRDYFWRLRDPQHADVAQALRLLEAIGSDEYRSKARRWIAEIRRNNTVLTFDLPGAAVTGKVHHLLMDVRNADRVAFELYRVQRPDELLFASQGVGRDFVYREHAPESSDSHAILRQVLLDEVQRVKKDARMEPNAAPAWKPEQLVHQWEVSCAELKPLSRASPRNNRRRHSWREDGLEDADADNFDDACAPYRRRLEKAYGPHAENALSSWRCDRMITIPAQALAEAGAYVLVARSNGQTSHVPIVVDPLSLILRRCRDGVFVVVSSEDGIRPIEGAQVLARGLVGRAMTDRAGVAFARVFAAGDRPILVHHQGRFALGGFGRLFEGIYVPAEDDEPDHLVKSVWSDRKQQHAWREEALVYADRHVVAAYTDRPAYRPGQDVQFKLIVRKQVPGTIRPEETQSFRAEDFDMTRKMVLPRLDQDMNYEVLDPKGRVVAGGVLKLNDFGTAAGHFTLDPETALGSYSLRVRIDGQPRLVPEVFLVRHYRRPNFEVHVMGVPDKKMKPSALSLKIASQYYFGPAVRGGAVQVRVEREGGSKTVAQARQTLDAKGQAVIDLPLPASMAGGKYRVACSITDASGRTVSQSLPLEIEAAVAVPDTHEFALLPRFMAIGQELSMSTSAQQIIAEPARGKADEVLKFVARQGRAALKFTTPGWYRLHAGELRRDEGEECWIFAYGGHQHPLSHDPRRRDEEQGPSIRPSVRWVNLSDFTLEEEGRRSHWEKPDQHLYILLDRQQVTTGDTVRLLVYAPYRRAKLLFTLEGRTIVDYAIHWTKESAGAYQVLEIPIKERFFPNVYLQGRILAFEGQRLVRNDLKDVPQRERLEPEQEEGIDPHWCRIDVSRLQSPAGEAPLKVHIETNQPHYRPGEPVHARILVTDRDGRPRAAELSFAAIDDSVFAFGEDGLERIHGFFQAPHEVRRFLPKGWRTSIGQQWARRLSAGSKKRIREQQALTELARQLQATTTLSRQNEPELSTEPPHSTVLPLARLGGEMPSGAIPLARLRENFQETATWLPQLRTDEAGIAKVAFTLPDSLTRYRLTAVALTRTTEVGVGRAPITAGLPLAVQVFLPRFAVEKDRLQAVAVIHNASTLARTCAFEWQVEGAHAELPTPGPQQGKQVQDKDRFVRTGNITVPANGSIKVGLWLRLDRLGRARIRFEARDGEDADAEVRTLPIEALGRPREVAINEALVRTPARPAEQQGSLRLPDGFLARELHLHLASSDIAQSLHGLEYLIEYPHGCIEQTMSRFLPAVMIQHATQQTSIRLQPEIADRLPEVLQKGLARIDQLQHADGSWGWFEKDRQNNPWTIYVLYGLARCRSTGIKVDDQVLQRGCAYLREELRAQRLNAELSARAWYVLALAGHAQSKELEDRMRRLMPESMPPEACCNLALACRVLGLAESGERLWARARTWQPSRTEGLALLLNTQRAYGASHEACGHTARALLAQRQGDRWYHTRDTSWAIEALANQLGAVPEKGVVRHLQVTLAGKIIFEMRDPAGLNRLSHSVRLSAEQLPAEEALAVRIQADSDRMVFVTVRATGVQRGDETRGAGTQVQLQRFLETLDGASLKGPLKVGQVFRVRLQLSLESPTAHLLIEERRPASCEFATDRVDGAASRDSVHEEFRDDRLCIYFASLTAGLHEVIYYLRAETPGQATMLTGSAYPMYDERSRGETGASKIEVKAP